jgi:hypothetical protein
MAARLVGRPLFDFDRLDTVAEAFRETAPWLVVNAAAYTAVDAAEDDTAAAHRANCDGPAELARLCEAAGIPLIHVSTDYVFDGRKGTPYVETDPTAPQCVYGATKLAGEQAVLAACMRGIVLRTSWVYAARGGNFYEPTILANVTQEMMVAREETFGPVAPIVPVASLDEAIALANSTRFGLGANVYTRDLETVVRCMREIKAGTVWFNDPLTDNDAGSFGGFKQSGLGRELGQEGLEAFQETKHVHIETKIAAKSWWYPYGATA